MRKNDLEYYESKDEQKKDDKKKLPARAYIGITISTIGFLMFISMFFVGDLFMNGSISIGAISGFSVGGMMLIIAGFLIGGYMVFARASANMNKHIIETNKDTLTDISNTGADITKGAVGTYARTIKDALNDNDNTSNMTTKKDKKYCKHCGKSIDADSKFCNYCGGEQ